MYTVRGKRKRRLESSIDNERSRRAIGRPMKPSSKLKRSRDAKNRQLLSATHYLRSQQQQETKRLSPLESLPVELIQHIFLLCLETSLPEASRRLASALSSESTYRCLILLAYFEDDGHAPVETNHFLPAQYRRLDTVEKVRLQSGITGCRWFTSDRYFSCVPVLSRLRMKQEWWHEHSAERILGTEGQIVLEVANSGFPLASLPDPNDQPRMEQHFDARQTPAANEAHKLTGSIGTTYLPRIVTWLFRPVGEQQLSYEKQLYNSSSIVGARMLPDWLILGQPWNANRLQLLQHLRQGNSFIDCPDSLKFSGAALLAGIKNAIIEKHIGALTTLLELHSTFLGCEPGSSLSKTFIWPSTHPIPPSMFHLAARQGMQAAQMITLLIRAGIDSIKSDDTVMTRWALRDEEAGGKVGPWLLRHMSGTNDYQLSLAGRLFNAGARSRRLNEGTDVLSAERTFAEELGYLVNHVHTRM